MEVLISFGLGVTVGDVNGDHYPDIYVSNDFFERDYLYINQKNGTFRKNWNNGLNISACLQWVQIWQISIMMDILIFL